MTVRILIGDCRQRLAELPAESVQCCVTSPPYFGLRDYGVAGQIGLEATPDAFVAEMVAVFREVRRVLRVDGVLFLNLGDSYHSGNGPSTGGASPKSTLTGGGGRYRAGSKAEAMFNQQQPSRGAHAQSCGTDDRAVSGSQDRGLSSWLEYKPQRSALKPKDLIGIPWRVAFALQADGWWLRQDIIWSKPNPMPESVTDRCSKAHEYVFLLSKSERYYFDAATIAEAGTGRETYFGSDAYSKGSGRCDSGSRNDDARYTRNKRSVWTVASQPYAGAHFATFPPALIEPCILAGCPEGGTVLDPFFGAGTTGLVADRLGRDCIGIELNPAYAEMARRRISDEAPMFATVTTEAAA